MSRGRQKKRGHAALRGESSSASRIIAVGGGKGGVGKSFVSSSLSIFLANMGFNTIVVDLDLGAANLHTSLGEGIPKRSLLDLVSNPSLKLEDIAIATRFPRLRLVSGANDSLEMANTQINNLSKIMSSIYNQKADYIVLDLSAGTHASTLDFFLMAQEHIVTVTPEPSSVENAYRFMKACFYRQIRRFERQLHLHSKIRNIMHTPKNYGVRSPADLLRAVQSEDEVNGRRLIQHMETLEYKIILNQIRTTRDADIGSAMSTIIQRYFGLPAEFLGALDYDNAVWQSLRKKKPLLLESPQIHLYNQILKISRNIAHPVAKKIVV